MKERKRDVQRFVLGMKKQSELLPRRIPKRLFLGMRLKGSLDILCPVLKTEGENEQAD